MTNVSLLLVATAVMVGGWNFGASWWKKGAYIPRKSPVSTTQTPQATGTVSVNPEFDAELNALLGELNSADRATTEELSELESYE
jgi:hypothetical protein